jgi:Flp pilus assembly protein TadB
MLVMLVVAHAADWVLLAPALAFAVWLAVVRLRERRETRNERREAQDERRAVTGEVRSAEAGAGHNGDQAPRAPASADVRR